MGFKIERTPEEGGNRSGIYHRIADRPNGVTIKTTGFPMGVKMLPEGTLLTEAENGLYAVTTTAKVVEVAGGSATDYAVAKGSAYIVGSKIIKNSSTSVNVTAINTADANKDVITGDATLGAKAVGDTLTEKSTKDPVAITGEEVAVVAGENCFASAWVIAVVNKNIIAEPAVKPAGVIYV